MLHASQLIVYDGPHQGRPVPRDKSLRAFDFEANPGIDPATVHTLATIHTLAICEWVKKGQPLRLIGDSGTGKSHLLIALRTEAAMKGNRVRSPLATKLVNELVEAADDKILAKTVARYGRVDLGFPPFHGHSRPPAKPALLLRDAARCRSAYGRSLVRRTRSSCAPSGPRRSSMSRSMLSRASRTTGMRARPRSVSCRA